jgi:hypothetical protein
MKPSFGGGFYNMASMAVQDSTVSRNYATQDGGGIADLGRNLTLIGSTVTRNNATVNAGGLLWSRSYPTLRKSRVVANTPNDIARVAVPAAARSLRPWR